MAFFGQNAPKELAVCETIGIFNTGAASKANNLESTGVVPGSNIMLMMLIGLRKEDEERIRNADKKVDIKNRCARRKRRAKKKIEAASRRKRTSYHPGAFGTSSVPEINLDGEEATSSKRKSKSKGKNQKDKAMNKKVRKLKNGKSKSKNQEHEIEENKNQLDKPIRKPISHITITFVSDNDVVNMIKVFDE